MNRVLFYGCRRGLGFRKFSGADASCARSRSNASVDTDNLEKNRRTHFGFETVTEDEKEERVYSVFHNVAEKYDLMNDVMSAGIHRLWKDHFVARIGPMSGTRIIDVAGGTGDIAFRCLKYVKNNLQDSTEDSSEAATEQLEMHVTVCDINQAMLDVGKAKADNLGYQQDVSWTKGNAEKLPFEKDSFDVYTVAFGIRNMTHIDKCLHEKRRDWWNVDDLWYSVLSEAYRVLRPGGRFMCLEFSEVKTPVIGSLYDQYSFQVIPVMGKLIAGDWKSYQYLVESIRKFPNQETFSGMIKEAGFSFVTYENLMFGVAAIHSGFKI